MTKAQGFASHKKRTPARGLLILVVFFGGIYGIYYLYQQNAKKLNEPSAVDAQITRFEAKREELEKRLETTIPEIEKKRKEEIATIKAELASTDDAGTKDRLTLELKEIAKQLLAVDSIRKETESLLSRVKQEERRLVRLKDTKELVGSDDKLLAELDEVWKEADLALREPIDDRIGSGVIAETLVDEKVEELLK